MLTMATWCCDGLDGGRTWVYHQVEIRATVRGNQNDGLPFALSPVTSSWRPLPRQSTSFASSVHNFPHTRLCFYLLLETGR